jgi:hypothetical protein
MLNIHIDWIKEIKKYKIEILDDTDLVFRGYHETLAEALNKQTDIMILYRQIKEANNA